MKSTSKAFVALAIAASLGTAASAQGIGEKSGVNSLVGRSPSTADFVKIAAISDMFEIESSKLAQQRADADSKAFAATMIKDHEGTSAEMKTMVQSGKVKAELPTGLDDAHKSKLATLMKAQGDDFDNQYDKMQVDAHQDAVSLFERYAKDGDNPDLKAFAAKTLPNLKHHLEMAKALK